MKWDLAEMLLHSWKLSTKIFILSVKHYQPSVSPA